MVLEKPIIQRHKISPAEHGKRQAKKGRYFNPYSFFTQRHMHNEFEAGWKAEQEKLNLGKVTTRTKYPHIAVLAFGIILLVIIWCMNS